MTSYCNYRCEASCAHTKGMGSNDTLGLLSTNNHFRCICPLWLRVINNRNISAIALDIATGMLRAALTPSRYPFPSVAACSNKGRRSPPCPHLRRKIHMLESNGFFRIFCFDFLWAYHLFLRCLLCLPLSTSVIIRVFFVIPVLFLVLLTLPKWHLHLANRLFFHITTFMLSFHGYKGYKHFLWMQCLFKGHQTIEHCTIMRAVVLCSASRPFVAVFSVRSHQECPCIRAKCMRKRYISSRQCDIEALNMVQCVFHHGAITISSPLIVLLVHTTPYAS